ncbi:glycine cleavage system aminomethyltransferase GcvT [Microbacterium enclense]|uniref:Aminomethyltransferase n=1 Tax=Microbacterium enclense TaxID=993073 RepID=A0A1G6HAR2_9MICO|nr:glycine cleavage system aminomethyltransferase GcvT [Microbacterium enclense]KSU55163.1 glycine cleavage system protein T [Microbacterium enclense]SDB91360.1 glycine cleavage system T protein [Microbacterium enclense]
MTETPAPPRTSPLHDRHEALGASFTDFGGWNMPVRYTSDLAEHRAVRETAGLFDISHMAEFVVAGPRAAAFLDYVLAGRLSTMKVGKAKYSLVLAASGGIVDDVIVYRTGPQSFLVISNAGNRDAVAAALGAAQRTWAPASDASTGSATAASAAAASTGSATAASAADASTGSATAASAAAASTGSATVASSADASTGSATSAPATAAAHATSADAAAAVPEPVEGTSPRSFAVVAGSTGLRVEDVTDSYALIALQGPEARGILGSIPGVEITGTPLDELGYYAWTEGVFEGASLFVARTGYTGEDGYELMIPTAQAGALWDAVLASGRDAGLVPCGLAARDTLRLEAGMPLYGHELSRDIVPAQAGLGRVVAVDKPAFVGKDGLSSAPGDAPVLVGLVAQGRRAGRAGYAVLHGDDVVGGITSGALSPTLGHPVAMAFVAPAASDPGTELTIDVRGTRIPATVTALPFYRRNA